MKDRRPSKKQIAMIAGITFLFLSISYCTTLWSFHYSSSTEFCISCHEMEKPYQQYKNSKHYSNGFGIVAECADCHLPPGSFSKWSAKVQQGVKDAIFHVLLEPDEIDHEQWRHRAVKNIPSEACRTCHKNLLPPGLPRGGFLAHRAFLRGDVKGTCLKCHNNLVHGSHPS